MKRISAFPFHSQENQRSNLSLLVRGYITHSDNVQDFVSQLAREGDVIPWREMLQTSYGIANGPWWTGPAALPQPACENSACLTTKGIERSKYTRHSSLYMYIGTGDTCRGWNKIEFHSFIRISIQRMKSVTSYKAVPTYCNISQFTTSQASPTLKNWYTSTLCRVSACKT